MGETVLLVGSGGREHALAWKIRQSPLLDQLFVAPGNAGTAAIANNVPLPADHVDELAAFARMSGVTLVVIGPDEPLALGLADRCRKLGIAAFGPSRAAACIEWSKAFAKEVFDSLGIPAPVATVSADADAARRHVPGLEYPVVIKASGLARGKGVFICDTPDDADRALTAIAALKPVNDERDVLVQQYVSGIEYSLHALTDGETVLHFPVAQDHKTLGEGGTGPMTGGMGVVVPIPHLTAGLTKWLRRTVTGLVHAFLQLDTPFTGCLYPGIIVTAGGVKFLEVNARFGDPEAQAYLRLMRTDLLPILKACANGTLRDHALEWEPGFAACVVLASEGYGTSEDFATGFPISGIEDAESIDGVVVFHGATRRLDDGTLVTAGGRVLHVTAVGATLAEAVDKAYRACDRVSFKGKTLRRDIGKAAIEASA